MAKSLSDAVLDAALDVVATADRVVVLSAQPTSYADVGAPGSPGTTVLGEMAVTNFDFTKADGDTSGRKLTFAGKTKAAGVTKAGGGSANHVALVDDGASRLLSVTTVPAQTLTQGNDLTVQAYKVVELSDVA